MTILMMKPFISWALCKNDGHVKKIGYDAKKKIIIISSWLFKSLESVNVLKFMMSRHKTTDNNCYLLKHISNYCMIVFPLFTAFLFTNTPFDGQSSHLAFGLEIILRFAHPKNGINQGNSTIPIQYFFIYNNDLK